MNRAKLFNSIEYRLNFLGYRITSRGTLNLLDLHIHSEDFYKHLFNMLFGCELVNMNEIDRNATAVDLVDHKKKIVIQVSSTATKTKIQKALKKLDKGFKNYRFKFISIAKGLGGGKGSRL